MKLEVGMYVRSHNIFKIGHPIVLMKLNKMLEEDDLKIKASHNLIDLIEVGDYVNGVKVKCIFKNQIMFDYAGNSVDVDDGVVVDTDIINFGIKIIEADIKEVLTKEQYEANKYVVEEE